MNAAIARAFLNSITTRFPGVEIMVFNRATGKIHSSSLGGSRLQRACAIYLLSDALDGMGGALMEHEPPTFSAMGAEMSVWVQPISATDAVCIMMKEPALYEEVDGWIRHGLMEFVQ